MFQTYTKTNEQLLVTSQFRSHSPLDNFGRYPVLWCPALKEMFRKTTDLFLFDALKLFFNKQTTKRSKHRQTPMKIYPSPPSSGPTRPQGILDVLLPFGAPPLNDFSKNH
jgi:hypothetical protein